MGESAKQLSKEEETQVIKDYLEKHPERMQGWHKNNTKIVNGKPMCPAPPVIVKDGEPVWLNRETRRSILRKAIKK